VVSEWEWWCSTLGGALVVLYNFEDWFLTLQEENMLRMINNRVLRRIFGLQKEEVIGSWVKLYNGQILDLYPS
jgi:hypothetical protein